MIFKLKIYLKVALIFCVTGFGKSLPLQLPIDHILSPLSLDEKIGQLIMAAVYNIDHNKSSTTHIEKLIKNYHIGSIIFLGRSNAEKQIAVTKQLQQISAIPLLIAQDLEWGLQMRMHNTIRFPHAMTLGALPPSKDYLIYELGKEIGIQCKALGVQMNLAPVVDVNNNPNNPIINDRSFGEDEKLVAEKAGCFMAGLQDAGIMSCAKHFPGHGNTDVDSHHDLPYIPHTKELLETIELYPFKQLIANGIKAVMTAHLEVPAFEPIKNRPATLSHAITTQLLQKELGFEGLVVTDSLEMRSVTNQFQPGILEREALRAGNSLLIAPLNVPMAVATIKEAVLDGTISEEDINYHVHKVLHAKEWVLQQYEEEIAYNKQYLHSPYAYKLKKKLYTAAITLVKNDNNHIPLSAQQYQEPIPVITIGATTETAFAQELKKQIPISNLQFPQQVTIQAIQKSIQSMPHTTTVIIALYAMPHIGMIETQSLLNKPDENTPHISQLIDSLAQRGKQTIIVAFINAYKLKYMQNANALIAAYEDDPDAQRAAAQVLYGKIMAQGKLPVSACSAFPIGTGLS